MTESVELEPLETTLNELIAALREKTGKPVTDEREAQILVAYMLSGVFGGDGPCSRSWH